MLHKEERREILFPSPSRGHSTFFGFYLGRRERWHWHFEGRGGCNAAKYPKIHWTAPHPQQRVIWPKVSKVQRLRNPGLELSSFPSGSAIKNLPAMKTTWIWSLGWEDPLEEGTATHSSILAWRIPWTEDPGGLKSTGSQSRTQLKRWAGTHAKYINP